MTLAASVLAIPEILDMVIEQAFTYSDALQHRQVNRLFRDATDKHLVASVDSTKIGIRTNPPTPQDRVHRLDLILRNNPNLWTSVTKAVVHSIEPLARLVPYGNLVSLTLEANGGDRLANLHAAKPFSLPKLSHLEIDLTIDPENAAARKKFVGFLASLGSLRDLEVIVGDHLADGIWLTVAQLKLPELLLGVAPKLRRFSLCATNDAIRTDDIGSCATLCSALESFSVSVPAEVLLDGITDTIPLGIKQLEVEGDHTVIKEVLVGLARPWWLPALTEVPKLRTVCYGREGDIIHDYPTQSFSIVQRAVIGLGRRGIEHLGPGANPLYLLVSGENSEDEFDSDLEDLDNLNSPESDG